MQMLNTILTGQMAVTDRLAGAGFSDEALEMLPKINMTLTKLAESAGIKNPDQFYLDIKPEKVAKMQQEAGQRPDPKMAEAQMKVQADAEKSKGELMASVQKMQSEHQIQMQSQQLEHERKIAQIDAEMALKREQLSAELALKRELAYAELDMKREVGLANAAKDDGGGTSSVHVGGEPG